MNLSVAGVMAGARRFRHATLEPFTGQPSSEEPARSLALLDENQSRVSGYVMIAPAGRW